ncbi:UDP-3-O-acyl-N-acetylglucosamine deacetylase [Candidatus Pelagibacter communis]|uniref:UDP-3-O-acyl-N-acetylglucosamine deacetylase n=1 Tax=Pelagibacter ubique TaxID=198252 RepID=UPI00094DB5DC|nr:UDP-3-O-acyl-N-acetylglucosamine deacetylase [Candidatus Pelagibacter ubique]
MSLLNQKTLKNSVEFEGIGLHSGKLVKLSIKPSEPDTGIVFKRIDLKNNNLVYPNYLNVSNTSLNTTISNDFGVKVSTIEHLMCALFSLGIDNALIEIDNEEVPILDGSAKEFIEKILIADFTISNKPIKIIKINKKVEFKNGEKFISIEPSKLSLDIEFELKYKNKIIGNQKNKINVYNDELKDILNSRTFCLYEDIEMIKKNGLAKGGSLDNAIVVKDENILNEDGLRNSKEFVNHKILDCIGDLFTTGYRIIGHVKCSQGGHYLTNQMLRKVFKNTDNFSIIEIQERNLPHTIINRSILRSIA